MEGPIPARGSNHADAMMMYLADGTSAGVGGGTTRKRLDTVNQCYVDFNNEAPQVEVSQCMGLMDSVIGIHYEV